MKLKNYGRNHKKRKEYIEEPRSKLRGMRSLLQFSKTAPQASIPFIKKGSAISDLPFHALNLFVSRLS